LRFTILLAAVITGLGLISAGFGGGPATVHAASTTIDLRATGAEETPPINETPGAIVHLVYDDATRVMSYSVTVQGISPDQVTASHFHRGARGVAGPVIYPLSTTGFTQISGTVTFAAADVPDLLAGNFYFNVHSVAHPGGFARAQIIFPATAAPAAVAAPAAAVAAPAAAPAASALPRTGTAQATKSSTTELALVIGLVALALGGAGVFAFRRS